MTAIGVIAPNTSTQAEPSWSPRHERGTGIQEGQRIQPSPERCLLNLTTVDGQHPKHCNFNKCGQGNVLTTNFRAKIMKKAF